MSTVVEHEEDVEELSQVEARTGRQVITSFNSAGERIAVGSVRYRDYEGNRAVRSLVLESELSGREHPLGSASSGFRTVSHSAVLEPFLDAGFQPRKVMHARGGASMIAILGHPDKMFADPIAWDREMLDPDTWSNVGELEFSVRIRSDLRRGHGVSATAGFYRLVCLNGLVAKILGLGHFTSTHRTFTPDQIQQFVDITPTSPDQMERVPATVLEEVLGIMSMEELSQQPRLLREPALRLREATNQTTYKALLANLEAIVEEGQDFSKLDLLNVQTNLAHATRSDWAVYRETDPMVRDLVTLVDLAGVRQGVKTFELN